MSFRPDNGTFSDFGFCISTYQRFRDYHIKPWISGNVFSCIIYGAIATLYFAQIQLMRKQYPKFQFTYQGWILLGYATLIFILCTLIITSSFQKTLDLLYHPICARDDMGIIPGGAGTMGNICFVITSWMADALLMWRCLIVYADFGRNKWLLVTIPFLLQVGSIGLGILFCYNISIDNHDDYTSMLYYEIITLTQNTILTSLIIARLWIVRNRVQKALGNNFGHEYTSVASMLIESQAITMVTQSFMVAFITHDAYGGPVSVTYQILAQFQALAPMLIMYRVLQGKAWSSNTYTHMTGLEFSKSTDPK